MALAPTLHDFDVQLSHVDRGIDRRLLVKAARHPSESLERLWLRLLAYCLWHQERIAFGPGLSDPEPPDLFADDLTGEKVLWIRVGRPDPARIQRESDRARRARVAVLFDSPARMASFADEAAASGIARLERVELCAVEPSLLKALAAVEERRARISLTVVSDHLYLERGKETLESPLYRANLSSLQHV